MRRARCPAGKQTTAVALTASSMAGQCGAAAAQHPAVLFSCSHACHTLSCACPAAPCCTLGRVMLSRAVVSQVSVAQLLGHLEEVGRVLLGGALQRMNPPTTWNVSVLRAGTQVRGAKQWAGL